jgi:hypothetical protein
MVSSTFPATVRDRIQLSGTLLSAAIGLSSSARLGLNRAFRNTRIAYRASITPAGARFRAPHVGRNPADLVTAKVRFARRSLHSAQLQAGQSERNVQGNRSFDGDRLQGEAAS